MNAFERILPAPIPTQDSQFFWEAAKEGRFHVKRCLACVKVHWYPRTLCPFCMSENTVWQESAGTGVIYTFSAMLRTAQTYIVAFVTLDEGPTLLTNIVNCDPATLAIGQRVRVLFRPSDGECLVPVFEPAGNALSISPNSIPAHKASND